MHKKFLESDKILVIQYQEGEKKALVLLIEKWHKTFCNKAFWLTKDVDASKDIAQDTWNVIIIKLKDLKNPNSFGSWALRIVYSKSFDWLRAQKRIGAKQQEYEHSVDNIEEEIEERELLKQQLKIAMDKLSMQQQMVIKLFYTEEYSLKEISKTLNISVGTTKSRLFHAREKLKQILKT